jgi:hypothetical protein
MAMVKMLFFLIEKNARGMFRILRAWAARQELFTQVVFFGKFTLRPRPPKSVAKGPTFLFALLRYSQLTIFFQDL